MLYFGNCFVPFLFCTILTSYDPLKNQLFMMVVDSVDVDAPLLHSQSGNERRRPVLAGRAGTVSPLSVNWTND